MKIAKPFLASLLTVLALVGCETESKEAQAASSAPQTTSKPTAPPADEVAGRKFQLRNLAVQDIKANGKTVHVWIMDTDAKRQEGMMFLKEANVKDDQGMLFVFHDIQPATAGFWMHNTVLPLDIIYINSQGKALNVQKGQPFDETSLPAKGDYQYTLELKQGQAKKLGIVPGTRIEIPAGITASE